MRQDESISNTDFILNMLNSCIGVGLLAKPYALCVAGWYSIIISVAGWYSIISVSIYSGYMMAQVTLTSCRIDVNHNIKPYQIVADTDHLDVPSDSDMEQSHDESHINNESVYYIIGTYSLGKHGQYYPIVSFLTTIALLSVNVIIIEYQLITGTLQYFGFNLNDNMIFISIFIALLPTVFIMKWKHITFVSVLSVLSIIVLIITFIVVWIAASNRFPGGYVSSERFQNTSFDHKNAAQFAIDRMTVLERILFAFFTLKSGINANSAIPQLVMSLKNKSHSNVLVVIFISYALVSIICVSFGAIGVVIYRSNVSVLILNNLFIWPSGICVIVVQIIKILNLWASYQFWICMMSDILCKELLTQPQPVKVYMIRILLLLLFVIIAYFTRHHLAFMTALFGAVDVGFGLGLLMPLVLYIGIFYCQMSIASRMFYMLLCGFAVSCSIYVIYGGSKGLLAF
eukprot:404069_1